jgi:predicted transcriptional regulator
MRESKIKDSILNEIKKKGSTVLTNDIAKSLNIPHYTILTLVDEIETDGYVGRMPIEDIGGSVLYITSKGSHFIDSTSYRRESIKKWWQEAPKNFWVIGAILGLLSTNAALIVELTSKDKSETEQKRTQESTAAKQDTLYLK